MSNPSASDESPPARPPWWRRVLTGWVLPLLGFAVLFVVIGQLRGPALDGPAPAFALQDLEGQTVSLADLRGKPVVLNFWATWCGPCKVEIPSFQRFAANNPDVHVVGIVADGPAPKVARFAQDAGMTYPIVMGTRAVQRDYGVSSYPTTVILDANGEVVSTHTGMMFRPQLWWATRGL